MNYAFKDKYLFEANLRYDGSSRFATGRRYSSFPSFSLGYRLSQEDFWSGIRNVVSDFKIRGSWGVTGNNGVQPYSYISTMQLVSYSFNGNATGAPAAAPGYLQKVIPYTDLTWEQTNRRTLVSMLNSSMDESVLRLITTTSIQQVFSLHCLFPV
ncbi:MAG: hypothetical protein WDO15_25590 [Bacteroidota bacterium]